MYILNILLRAVSYTKYENNNIDEIGQTCSVDRLHIFILCCIYVG